MSVARNTASRTNATIQTLTLMTDPTRATRMFATLFLLSLLCSVVLLRPVAAAAQALPVCSWPLETTGTGISNVAYPDTNATYWTMPFDSSRWREMIITGTYPESRFMSFITYNATGSIVDSILDFAIKPDVHGENPFTPGKAGNPKRYGGMSSAIPTRFRSVARKKLPKAVIISAQLRTSDG